MRGDGSITHRGADRWRLEFVNPRTRKRHTRTVRAKNRTEAKRSLADFRDLILEQGKRDLEAVTLQEAHEAFLASQDFERRKAKNKMRVSLKHLINHFGGQMLLRDIDSMDMQGFQAERLKKVTPTSVRTDLGCITALFRFGQERCWISQNPVAQMARVRAQRNPHQRWVSREEMDEVFKAVEGHETWEPFYLLAWYQGWRRDNILTFKMEMIEEVGDHWAASFETKTGHKTFRIHSKVREYLEGRVGREGHVVLRKGRPFNPRSFDRLREYDSAKLGLELPTGHACRRGAATAMYKAGATLKQVGAVLGHSTEQQTREYLYGLVTEGQEAVEFL